MREELQSLRSENERLRYEINIIQNQQREAFTAIDRKIRQFDNDMTLPSDTNQVISGEGIINEATINDGQVDSGASIITQQQNNSSQSSTQNIEMQDQQSESMQTEFNVAETIDAGSPEGQSSVEAEAVVIEQVDMKAALTAYRDAFMLLKQNEHEPAISAFEAFLINYPVTKYSANAQYWLGEANYVAKRYEIALQEFQKVLDIYPDSSKIPDARLKIGYTQYELEQWEEARATLGRLRAQLPDTKVAGLAQQRLERMDREGH
jgi:tol-pal system protein YbgF